MQHYDVVIAFERETWPVNSIQRQKNKQVDNGYKKKITPVTLVSVEFY